MKKLFFALSIGLSLTAMSCSNNQEQISAISKQTEQKQTAVISKNVDVTDFTKLVGKGEGQILDVRTPEEWSNGIIKGAIKMNYFDKDFETQLNQLDKNKPVYVYCKVGGRSGKATKKMKQMGFTTVYNLKGGIGAWTSAGNEIVR